MFYGRYVPVYAHIDIGVGCSKDCMTTERFADLLSEIKNPVYPNAIREELKMIANKQFVCRFD